MAFFGKCCFGVFGPKVAWSRLKRGFQVLSNINPRNFSDFYAWAGPN